MARGDPSTTQEPLGKWAHAFPLAIHGEGEAAVVVPRGGVRSPPRGPHPAGAYGVGTPRGGAARRGRQRSGRRGVLLDAKIENKVGSLALPPPRHSDNHLTPLLFKWKRRELIF